VVSGKRFFDVFYPPTIRADGVHNAVLSPASLPSTSRIPVLSCLVLLCVAGVAAHLVATRQEIIPQRKLFVLFPDSLGDWRGRPSSLDAQTEHGLGLTDYILSDYAKKDGRAVNLYVAYYANQKTGSSPHSPSVCIPGNGWSITSLERTSYESADASVSLPLNRVVIAKGQSKQLVYYWFEERGMKVANEYWSKLYLLRDALFENRTDGALVRLTTPVYPGEAEAEAEKRLQEFIQMAVPNLAGYLPAVPSAPIKPAMISPKEGRS